jgi:hypothetical protein
MNHFLALTINGLIPIYARQRQARPHNARFHNEQDPQG